jgi:hypothetical protein
MVLKAGTICQVLVSIFEMLVYSDCTLQAVKLSTLEYVLQLLQDVLFSLAPIQ